MIVIRCGQFSFLPSSDRLQLPSGSCPLHPFPSETGLSLLASGWWTLLGLTKWVDLIMFSCRVFVFSVGKEVSVLLALLNYGSKRTGVYNLMRMSRKLDSLLWCDGGCHESLTFWGLPDFYKDNEGLIMQLKKQR